MPLDHAPQPQNSRAVWIWDLEVRRIRAANRAALSLWDARTQNELANRAFAPGDPMTRAAEEADAALTSENAHVTLIADLAGQTGLKLRVDRPVPHLLRFAAPSLTEETSEPPRGRENTPQILSAAAFETASVAMSVIDATGAVLQDNHAARALFRSRPGGSWLARHIEPGDAGQALDRARRNNADSYIGALVGSAEPRWMSVSLSRLDTVRGYGERFVATCLPIPEEETSSLRGNPGENVLQSAPAPVAVFSLESDALLFANARALTLAPAFGEEATLTTLFPEAAAGLRDARRKAILDERRAPQWVDLPTPGAPGRMLRARVTMTLWRAQAALCLWLEPAPPKAEPALDPIEAIAQAAEIAKFSHELRNSVTAAKGFAELLLAARGAPDDTEERLRAILSASEEIETTLERFLEAIARFEKRS